MGSILEKFFIEPSELSQDGYGMVQVIFLGLVYGNILKTASHWISDGSELLLLVPALAGLVGSVVLPILGAVPDGAIVLFSGLGPDAQEELQIGVGALAGSTIMLLTVPWFLSIVGGRVTLDNGEPRYTKPRGVTGEWKKLDTENMWSLSGTGVGVGATIRKNAVFMIVTALTYLVIQVPAFYYATRPIEERKVSENPFAFWGMILAFVLFCAYLWYQKRQADLEMIEDLNLKKNELRVTAIKSGLLTLRGAMAQVLEICTAASAREIRSVTDGHMVRPLIAQAVPETARNQMKEVLRPFFHELDKDKSNHLDVEEVRVLFKLLNEDPNEAELRKFIEAADVDKSGVVEFEEFVDAMIVFVLKKPEDYAKAQERRSSLHKAAAEEEEEEEEEEEMPEDLAHLSPAEQQRRVKQRAFLLMAAGTALVLIFADPMVGVFSDIGRRTNVPSFYVSFILAPLASNLSEVIAAYAYAQKKTMKTMTISLSTLEGAACMNNTFCLCIFLVIIYVKSLVWTFSAETVAILAVEAAMAAVALLRRTQTLVDGLVVLSFYPLSLALVYALETYAGWD